MFIFVFFFSSRRRHTRCALVTGVQTCALPICAKLRVNMQQEALMQERVAPITASRNTEMLRGLIMTACCGLLMTVILPSLRIIEQAWKSAATANLLPLPTMALVRSLILLTPARHRRQTLNDRVLVKSGEAS